MFTACPIYNGPTLETTQLPANSRMDRGISHNAILYSSGFHQGNFATNQHLTMLGHIFDGHD